jgi:DNA modification methylase
MIQAKEIQVVDIDSLVLNPKNNNKHPKEQIERLAKLIQYQGFRNPVVVSKRTGFVLAGHGRIEAAKLAGLKEVPAMFQDFDNEAQEYAYLTSDNAIAAWAELDLSAVNTEMLDLGPDFDIDLLGIKDFVIEPIEKFEPQSDEDAVPDVVHPITRKGDLWILGKHRLLCGDSTMIDDVVRLMGGEKADMVFTDPPYNVDFKGQELSHTSKNGQMVKGHKGANTKHNLIKNDALDKEEFYQFMISVLTNLKTLEPKAWYFSFLDLKLEELLNPLRDSGFDWKSIIIWAKNQATLSGKDYKSRYEPIVYGCLENSFYGERYKQEDVWEFQRTLKNDLHPTMKPIPLIENAINNSSKNGHLVIDMFLGSGSTLIACEKTSRKCYGMELDEKYCDVIIKRWEQYTGKKAVLESTNQTYEELKVERDGTTTP